MQLLLVLVPLQLLGRCWSVWCLQSHVCLVAQVEKDRPEGPVGCWLPELIADEYTLLESGGAILRVPLHGSTATQQRCNAWIASKLVHVDCDMA